jgi:hypothetical protein
MQMRAYDNCMLSFDAAVMPHKHQTEKPFISWFHPTKAILSRMGKLEI